MPGANLAGAMYSGSCRYAIRLQLSARLPVYSVQSIRNRTRNITRTAGRDVTFPSKKDSWLGIIIWGSFVFGLAMSILAQTWWLALILVAFWAFVAWVWFTTGYTIDDGKLQIRSGPFSQTVAIDDITSVKPTRNPLASLALSIDRLEVRYGRGSTLISPLDKDGFIKALQAENSAVEVK